jgi:phosphohistidine phosphatase
MTKELWLMRHGKAQRFDGIEDYDRALRKRGKLAARKIGEWLNDNRMRPDLIISSPASRAYATACIVCAELGMDPQDIVQDKRLYDEGMVRTKAVLNDFPGHCQKVLVVGHNPELEILLRHLIHPIQLPEVEKLIPTAALARLGISNEWSALEPHSAELLSLTYPKSLMKQDAED